MTKYIYRSKYFLKDDMVLHSFTLFYVMYHYRIVLKFWWFYGGVLCLCFLSVVSIVLLCLECLCDCGSAGERWRKDKRWRSHDNEASIVIWDSWPWGESLDRSMKVYWGQCGQASFLFCFVSHNTNDLSIKCCISQWADGNAAAIVSAHYNVLCTPQVVQKA